MQTVVLGVRRLAARRAASGAAAALRLLGPQSWSESVPSRLGVGPARQARASQSVCLPCSTDWRVRLPKLEWMALTACCPGRRPPAGAALPGGPGGQPRLIGPGPEGSGRQGPASLSVHQLHPAGRTGGADCLRQAGRLQTILYIFYFWNSTKNHLGTSHDFASTPYSSGLFLVSRSLFHFFNFTLRVSIQLEYQRCIWLEFPLW